MPVEDGPRPDRLEFSHALEDWREGAAHCHHVFHLHHLCRILLSIAKRVLSSISSYYVRVPLGIKCDLLLSRVNMKKAVS